MTNHSFAASIPLGRRIWQKIEFGQAAGLETKNGCIWSFLHCTDQTMQGPAEKSLAVCVRVSPFLRKSAFAASLRPDLWISLGQRQPLSRAERSEFIVSLDSGSRWPHRKYSGRGDAGLILAPCYGRRQAIFNHPFSTLRARFHQFRWFGIETDAHFCRPPSSTPPFSAPPPVSPDCGSHVLARASAPLQVAH